MVKKKMPPDYLVSREDQGYIFLIWDGDAYTQPLDGGWCVDENGIVNVSWSHYYESIVEEWNADHFDDEKIFGYEIERKRYHPGCVTFELPRGYRCLNVFQTSTEECQVCGEPLLEEQQLTEYYGCVNACSCLICQEVAKVDGSDFYRDGYRRGLWGVIEEKEPPMTQRQYAAMIGYEDQGSLSEFLAGYLAGREREKKLCE